MAACHHTETEPLEEGASPSRVTLKHPADLVFSTLTFYIQASLPFR